MTRKMPRQRPHVSQQVVCTPPEFIEAVERRLGPIGFDLACTSKNVIGGTRQGFFFDKGQDAFASPWVGRRKDDVLQWGNPPFDDIARFVERAAMASENFPRTRIALLLPASVGANWYRDHVHNHAYVLALSPRLTFVGHKHAYPKDLMLAVYGHGFRGFDGWRWTS